MRLQTRAFAIASGFLTSAGIFLLTLLLLAPAGRGVDASLLGSFLFGYSVSLQGAFIGAMWAFGYGFLFGATFAFVYNVVLVPPAPPVMDPPEGITTASSAEPKGG